MKRKKTEPRANIEFCFKIGNNTTKKFLFLKQFIRQR